MIRTESVGRVVRRAEPPWRARWTARTRGRRDGYRGLPHVPEFVPVLPGPEAPVTDYIRERQATARRAVEQLRSRLLDREWILITDIRRQAVLVVTQYDVRRQPAPAALAGFGGRVAEWRTKADVCRCRATAVTEQINQQIACYWDALRRHHRDVPEPAPAYLARWAPAPLELDPGWRQPDTWLSDPGTPTATVSALARALQLLDTQRGGA